MEFLGVEEEEEAKHHSASTPTESHNGKGVRARLRDTAMGQERWVTSKYLVGADGAHSAVRKSMGVAFEGSAYPEEFFLLDGKCE